MSRAAADSRVALDPEAALALWTDPRRWATFVEGFGHVVERDPGWPEEGATIVWESKPEGRGRVTEKVVERRPGRIRALVFEDRLQGVQTARFDEGRVLLELEYELTAGGPLRALVDLLFVRWALRDMLRRTVARFAAEAEEEAALR